MRYYFFSISSSLRSVLFIISGTFGGRFEKKLLRDLMVDYDNLERPVVNESHPLLVTFGITLQQIIDVVSFILGLFIFSLVLKDMNLIKFKKYGNINIFYVFQLQDEKNQLLVSCLWLNLVSAFSNSFLLVFV